MQGTCAVHIIQLTQSTTENTQYCLHKAVIQLTQSTTENTQYSLHKAVQKMHSTAYTKQYRKCTAVHTIQLTQCNTGNAQYTQFTYLPTAFLCASAYMAAVSSVHTTQCAYSIYSRVPVHRKQYLMTTISNFKDFEILCLSSSQIFKALKRVFH